MQELFPPGLWKKISHKMIFLQLVNPGKDFYIATTAEYGIERFQVTWNMPSARQRFSKHVPQHPQQFREWGCERHACLCVPVHATSMGEVVPLKTCVCQGPRSAPMPFHSVSHCTQNLCGAVPQPIVLLAARTTEENVSCAVKVIWITATSAEKHCEHRFLLAPYWGGELGCLPILNNTISQPWGGEAHAQSMPRFLCRRAETQKRSLRGIFSHAAKNQHKP